MEPPINILIVDDEPKNLTVLETVLDDPGYRLVRAESADKALLALVNEEFALLILDIRMPGMTGFELAQIIKKRTRTARVPIIFLTAYYNEDQHVLEGYDVGAVDYLHKPVNAAVLRSKVAVFAELHRKQRAAEMANRTLLTEVVERRRAEERLRELNDTLDQRVAERTEALRSSDARLSSILQNITACIYEMDSDNRFVHINRHFENVFNLKVDLVRGKSIHEVFPPEIAAQFETNNRKVLSGGIPVEAEEIAPHSDGLHTYLSIKVPRFDADGAPVGVFGISTDITERKRFENEREGHLANEQMLRAVAETANRAKDMFLATLSHEMRTPLNAVVGWMSILRKEGCGEEDLKEGLDVIDRNTKAQVQLIEDLLDVSRIVSGKLRLEIRSCDLREAIKAGIDVVRPAAEAREIALDVQLDPSTCAASCDAVRMQQVIWNLVSNAVKFTPRGGTVRIRLGREHSALQIQVADSGQGISPELLPFVFDRFRQADSSTRRKFGGLGLGLSIVKHLVELHGGTVQAHSDGEGKGSTFTVRLPIRAVQIDDEADEPARDVSGNGADANGDGVHTDAPTAAFPLVRLDGLRVLMVDDEADARRILVKVLEGAGAVVTAAASAREAIEALANARPDVLVSDLGMPHEDGFDLIREVRGRGHHPKDLPAVALTAFVHKDDQREALLAGFQVHVSKPVDPHDLTSVIASLIGRTS